MPAVLLALDDGTAETAAALADNGPWLSLGRHDEVSQREITNAVSTLLGYQLDPLAEPDLVRYYRETSVYQESGASSRQQSLIRARYAFLDGLLDRIADEREQPVALDVGCGFGAFLGTLDDRWQRTGVELNKERAAYARDNFRAGVSETTLEQAAVPAGSVDFLSGFGLLEHLLDPNSFLREVRRVLRPGGYAMVNVPDTAEPIVAISRFFTVEHTLYFTRRTLRALLKSHGFRVVSMARMTPDYPDIACLFATVIRLALAENGADWSYKRASGLAELIDGVAGGFKLHPEISTIDTFSIKDDTLVLYFPHPDCRTLHPDPELVVANSSHLWTHDPAGIIEHRFLRPVTHAFYLLRDGRDAVNSLAHHTARPEVHRVIRNYRLDTVEKVYADADVLATYIKRWAEHARSYLEHRERYHLVRFEQFVADPAAVFREAGLPFGLYHCVSIYPHEASRANLRLIRRLEERYRVPVGYSCHEFANTSSLLAVPAGAVTLERHVTFDRNAEGFDHRFALDMPALAEFVQQVREAEASMGDGAKTVMDEEWVTRRKYHASVVSARPIAAGETIRREMLAVKNPGTGIPAREIDSVAGRTAATDIPADVLIERGMLADN